MLRCVVPEQFSAADVERLARLARLALTDDETTLFARQLGDVLSYARQLQQLDTSGIPPTSHAIGAPTDSRPDEDRAATRTWRPGWIYPDLHNLVLPRSPGRYTLTLALTPDGQPAPAPWQPPVVLLRQ